MFELAGLGCNKKPYFIAAEKYERTLDVRGGLTTMCFSSLAPSNVSGDISSEKS